MTGAEFALGIARGTHMAAAMSMCGAMGLQSIVARPSEGSASEPLNELCDRRIHRLISISLAAAVMTALIWLFLEAASVTGSDANSLIGETLPIILLDSHFGTVLMLRVGLLAAAWIIFGTSRSRWRQGTGAVLALMALALQAGLGHGPSMEGEAGIALLVAEGLHIVSAALWLGGLAPLLILVATLPAGAAVGHVRRFSALGTICVALLLATILVQSWVLIGSLAGLVGTDYGRIALFKSAMLVVLIGLAALNRWRFAPLLSSAGAGKGRMLLLRSITIESACGLLVILGAGILMTQPPAMHEQPLWPFASQLNWSALSEADLRPEVLLGVGQALIGGLLLGVSCLCLWQKKRIAAAASLVAAMLPFWLSTSHLDLLLVPAYPTSFFSSPTGFTAAAITEGSRLFPAHCASCHGADGRGDGPLAKASSIPPADLTAPHLFGHSDGELFWWLSHGMDGPDGDRVMPGFAALLDDDERWNLIDYIRAHNIGLSLHDTGSAPQPIQAPDMTVTRDGSLSPLSTQRAEIVRLVAEDETSGRAPPIAIDCGVSITTFVIPPRSDGWMAYSVMAGVPAEQLAGTTFLIDRGGWLRAVLRPAPGSHWPDPSRVVAAAHDAEAISIGDPATGHPAHHH